MQRKAAAGGYGEWPFIVRGAQIDNLPALDGPRNHCIADVRHHEPAFAYRKCQFFPGTLCSMPHSKGWALLGALKG